MRKIAVIAVLFCGVAMSGPPSDSYLTRTNSGNALAGLDDTGRIYWEHIPNFKPVPPGQTDLPWIDVLEVYLEYWDAGDGQWYEEGYVQVTANIIHTTDGYLFWSMHDLPQPYYGANTQSARYRGYCEYWKKVSGVDVHFTLESVLNFTVNKS